MKIFYSWQSDTPSKIGKAFIRGALDLALEKINSSMNFDEAERPSIDQDTQGIMGSPSIAETIFDKIRISNIVVADVTLVGSVEQGKKLINSNVGYELGFAHGYHGDNVILSVMNTHYGSPENLPFDLKHRRWPVQFELSPDANKSTRREEREKLATQFAAIFKLNIENGAASPEVYEPIPSTNNPAMYWHDGEYLIDDTLGGEDYPNPLRLTYTEDQPLIYMRIWPDIALKELTGKQLSELKSQTILPIFIRDTSIWYDRNEHGIMSHSARGAAGLTCITQAFQNGELWGIDSYLLSARERGDKYNFNFVPTSAFERGITESLRSFLRLAKYLEYPKAVHIEVGMVNVKGFKLALPNHGWQEFSDPIMKNISVKVMVDQEDDNSFNLATSQIFSKVYDAVGLERPKG